MHRISASASRSLPRDDLRRFSYKLSYPDEERRGVGQRVLPDVCRCPLPERPDAWSDVTWRKFLTAMARLPCKGKRWRCPMGRRRGDTKPGEMAEFRFKKNTPMRASTTTSGDYCVAG
ncbi:unnamed protein product [Ectocarpus sp. 4 AP-2014]